MREKFVREELYSNGMSYASHFLRRCPVTVRTYTDSGQLPCIRDDTGRRLFRLSDLKEFKKKYLKDQVIKPRRVSTDAEVRDQVIKPRRLSTNAAEVRADG